MPNCYNSLNNKHLQRQLKNITKMPNCYNLLIIKYLAHILSVFMINIANCYNLQKINQL